VRQKKVTYLSQKNVGIRNDKVALQEQLALGRSSKGEEDLRRLDASPAARNSTTNIIPQISLPKHWRWSEKMIGVP